MVSREISKQDKIEDKIRKQYALDTGNTFYQPTVPCIRGHLSKRYARNRDCCQCIQERSCGKANTVTHKSIMESWDATTHSPAYKKLPILRGTLNTSKVVGFFYIDADIYDEVKHLRFGKISNYVVFNVPAKYRDNPEYKKLLGKGQRGSVYIHRFILGLGYGNALSADHKNRRPLDNRRRNLRTCTHKQNSSNISSYRGTSSIYVGVSWNKKDKVWRASVKRNGVVRSKGFKDEIDAAKWRDSYLKEHYPSEFNNYNFPKDND